MTYQRRDKDNNLVDPQPLSTEVTDLGGASGWTEVPYRNWNGNYSKRDINNQVVAPGTYSKRDIDNQIVVPSAYIRSLSDNTPAVPPAPAGIIARYFRAGAITSQPGSNGYISLREFAFSFNGVRRVATNWTTPVGAFGTDSKPNSILDDGNYTEDSKLWGIGTLSGTANNRWLSADFGSPVPVDALYQVRGGSASYYITTFTLQTSDDGIAWTTVGDYVFLPSMYSSNTSLNDPLPLI